jgi:hypothetical protein
MQPIHTPAYSTGLQTNLKSNVIPDDAFQVMENAFIENAQVKRKLGNDLVGRLRRVFNAQALGNTTGATTVLSGLTNLFTTLSITDPNKELEPGSLVITVAAPNSATFTDNGNGTFTVTGVGIAANSWVDYKTGDISLSFSAYGGAAAITANFAYFPSRPVMGIYQREIAGINKEETIVFDTAYAYKFDNASQKFQELVVGTTWTGADDDFFWATNYRATNAYDRTFFATNFVSDSSNPIRYFNGSAWTSFIPLVSATDSLFQARFIVPYYGRLLCLNTYEGVTADGASLAQNYFNRCTYSQIGSPVAVDAYRRDIFGKGGFVDAPVNEEIMGVGFFKNTLMVRFENSTWMLRYVGEYGLPFIWEQVDASLGSESYMSTIPMDTGVVSVGEKGITIANPSAVERIDQKIKNLVFDIANTSSGPERVVGAREYQKQFLYWCYTDSNTDSTYPTNVLVYNYFQDTWSIFRDNVTFFGLFQNPTGISWDSLSVYWDDNSTFWDDADNQSYFPFVISGNQEGFVHYYNRTTALENQGALSITAIDRSLTPPRITVTNHNLVTDELIYIYDINFITKSTGATLATTLNDSVYQVEVIDANTLALYKWNGSLYVDNFSYTPANGSGDYIGGGKAVLLPILNVITKDFNPFQQFGKACKFVKADLLVDTQTSGQFVVNTYSQTSPSGQGNATLIQDTATSQPISNYYLPNSQYASHPIYALTYGQFVRLQYTMDNVLMNDTDVIESNFVLNGSTMYFKPAGKISY